MKLNDIFGICAAILIIGLSICIPIGVIFGIRQGDCKCPANFGNFTVIQIGSPNNCLHCLIVNNSNVVNIDQICKHYDHYEVAIVFFAIAVFFWSFVILCVCCDKYENYYRN